MNKKRKRKILQIHIYLAWLRLTTVVLAYPGYQQEAHSRALVWFCLISPRSLRENHTLESQEDLKDVVEGMTIKGKMKSVCGQSAERRPSDDGARTHAYT